MTIDDILIKIKNSDERKEIKRAYDIAEKYCANIKRKNGDTLLSHVLEVTNILCDLNVDKITIISALLHEINDHIDIDNTFIKDEFGDEVLTVINSLYKINHLEMVDNSEDSAIYLRKVMVGLSEDVRVIFIKLADRLHNMRTMESFSQIHQKKVANETLNVLIPIAHRLGVNFLKSELENLCLYYLKPNVYNDILEKLNISVAELNDYLEDMKESISQLLIENGIKFEIKGRVKSVYSIYNKLSNGKKWEDIYDILALRIFVEKESDCYAVVGIIHSKYRPVQNRFKDYIAIPKENMYQSLHTTIFGEGGRFFEIQIRTYEMDEIAEKGIASHWSYKEKGAKKTQTIMEQKLELYRSIIENASENDDKSFIDIVDDNLLNDLIYVFTPKGDVVELPKGSTPIDFAYKIHSKVGDTMVGAIVNNKMVPINYELQDNDIIKVMTNPTAKPSKSWIKIVKTTQARDKIKAYFSKVDKEENILKGKNIIEREIRKRKIAINEILSDENVETLCKRLKLKDLDDLYLSIAAFKYTANSIINFVTEDESQKVVTNEFQNKNFISKNDILVDGKDSISTHLAKCCNPIKGDDIVGIITKTDGIAVHRRDCENIQHLSNKFLDVSWDINTNNTYTCSLLIKVVSEKDLLSDIITTITSLNIHINSINNRNSEYLISLNIKNVDELNKLLKNINKLRLVKDVIRL